MVCVISSTSFFDGGTFSSAFPDYGTDASIHILALGRFGL
jgi:hypothetical protein